LARRRRPAGGRRALAHHAVSGSATVIATLLGVAMALLVARSDVAFRRLFAAAWVTPLVVPAYVTAWPGWTRTIARG